MLAVRLNAIPACTCAVLALGVLPPSPEVVTCVCKGSPRADCGGVERAGVYAVFCGEDCCNGHCAAALGYRRASIAHNCDLLQ